MKIATWNVNSLKVRMPRVLEFLEQHRPDLLLMQETKSDPGAFPVIELEAAGYQAVHHSAGRWAGVALAAPAGAEITDVRTGLEGEPAGDEARWLEATVGRLGRCPCTCPTDARWTRRPTWTSSASWRPPPPGSPSSPRAAGGGGRLQRLPTDLDVYDPAAFVGSTHVTPAERERFAALLDAGVVDAFRELHPDEPGFTWWDYRQGHFHRKMGLRIDAVLLSPPLAERLESCGIDRNYRKGPKPSDHAPLLADLRA